MRWGENSDKWQIFVQGEVGFSLDCPLLTSQDSVYILEEPGQHDGLEKWEAVCHKHSTYMTFKDKHH